jgi:cyclophilin family peptidyl-prolyl cis-trans isomerase
MLELEVVKGPMEASFSLQLCRHLHLNNKHTIFGEVTKGYEVIKALETVKTGPGDRPIEAIKILKIYQKAE